jgi:isopentenyldiphosphate isomerase
MTVGANEELWQAYDERGEPLAGESMTKPEAAKGALHGASHTWLWRVDDENTEILLQHRAEDKKTWPGYLDISAAGHVDFGETPLQAAVRETREELGINLDPTSLRLLFVHRQRLIAPPEGYIENEFQWVYGLRLDKQEINVDHDEVEGVIWLKLADLQALAVGQSDGQQIVPHGKEYFANLLKELHRRRP